MLWGVDGELDLESADTRVIATAASGVDVDHEAARLDVDVRLDLGHRCSYALLTRPDVLEAGPRSCELVENSVDIGTLCDRSDPIA